MFIINTKLIKKVFFSTDNIIITIASSSDPIPLDKWRYNLDRVLAINKNSGLSKLLRATLKSNFYLSRFIYRRALRVAAIRKEALRLSGRCRAKWLAAERTPKKKSSSRLLRKKRGTADPRERAGLPRSISHSHQRNKFVVHISSDPSVTPWATPVILSFPPVFFDVSPWGSWAGRLSSWKSQKRAKVLVLIDRFHLSSLLFLNILTASFASPFF